jgi:2-methylisocitrate lyase-like PEP mutase family enzyme
MSSHLLRSLHQGPGLLLLPNAWDAGSARLIESFGAKAIATTSAGLAWAHGYSDGNALPEEQLIAAIRDIGRVIRVPLTVDIETGYSDDPLAVARLVERLLALGVAGINIEDGAGSPELLYEKIVAIQAELQKTDCDLFINVRTDVILRGTARGQAAIKEILSRAARCRAAGADGLFVPGLSDAGEIAAIATAIAPMPLNVMAIPALPSMDTLRNCGVRRVSAGSSVAQAALGRASQLVAAFLAGSLSEMFETSVGYDAMNRLFATGG